MMPRLQRRTTIRRKFLRTGFSPGADMSGMFPPTTYDYFPEGLPSCPVTQASRYTMDVYKQRVLNGAEKDGAHMHWRAP